MGLCIHCSPFFSNRAWWISALLCWCCHNSDPTVTWRNAVNSHMNKALKWTSSNQVANQMSLRRFSSGNLLSNPTHCGSPLPSFQREEHLLLANFGASGGGIFAAWGICDDQFRTKLRSTMSLQGDFLKHCDFMYNFRLGIWEGKFKGNSSHITGWLKCHFNFGKVCKLKSNTQFHRLAKGAPLQKQMALMPRLGVSLWTGLLQAEIKVLRILRYLNPLQKFLNREASPQPNFPTHRHQGISSWISLKATQGCSHGYQRLAVFHRQISRGALLKLRCHGNVSIPQ